MLLFLERADLLGPRGKLLDLPLRPVVRLVSLEAVIFRAGGFTWAIAMRKNSVVDMLY